MIPTGLSSILKVVIDAKNEASKELKQVEKDVGGVTKKLQKMEPAFKKMAMAGGMGLAAISGAIALSVKEFASFDDAMTKSTAIMGDVSDELRDKMERNAREIAKTTTFSAKEAADSYFYLASAGLDASQAIASLPAVAEFATAGAFDMALATDLLTDAQSALGLTVEDATKNMENMTRVSDVLVKANTLANATVQQFSQSLTTEAGAALKTFNKDIEEGVAVLAAFADQGVKGQVAGSGLSRVMRLLSKAANDNKEEMEALGISVYDSEGKMRNFADIIEDMEDALLGMSDEQRTVALESIGFTARIQGMILPLLGTSDAIRGYERGLRDAGGVTKEVADKQLESFSSQMSMLKSKVKDAAIEIGDTFAPTIAKLMDKIGPLIEKFVEWVEKNKGLVIAITVLTGSIFALLLGLGAMGLLLPKLAMGFGYLKGSIIGTKIAAMGLSAVPIVAVFTALAIAVSVVYNELSKFAEEVGSLKVAWSLTMMNMKIAILGFAETTLNALNKVYQYIPGLRGVISEALSAIRSEIRLTEMEFDKLAVSSMKKTGDSAGELEKDFDELSKGVEESMIDATTSVGSLGESVEDLGKKIEDENKRFKDEMERDEENFYNAISKKVAEYEIDIKEKQKEVTRAEKEGNQERAESLRSEIEEKQNQLNLFYSWDLGLSKEINWEKTLLELGELQRMYATFIKKRAAREEEHKKVLEELQERQDAQQRVTGKELENIEEVKNTFINAQNDMTSALENRILFQQKASMSRIGGGDFMSSPYYAGGFQHGGVVPGPIGQPALSPVHGGETIVPPNKGIGSMNITITGNTFMSDEEAAEQIGDRILKIFKRRNRIIN